VRKEQKFVALPSLALTGHMGDIQMDIPQSVLLALAVCALESMIGLELKLAGDPVAPS
jgi:hypothetical protein